jgi:ribosomal protein L16 Arg81 hydroxylase
MIFWSEGDGEGVPESDAVMAASVLAVDRPLILDSLLAPVTRGDFFRDYWTREFLHIPGPPDKFDRLFSWEILNRALEEHRFESNQLRLVKSGSDIAPNRYLQGRFVHSGNLVKELAGGATLIFNACDEVHRPLRDLCEELERLFHHPVGVNLYAGWRRDNGFDTHWDRQETLILHLAGRKRWKVWKPTRLFPFKDDVVDTSHKTAPGSEPIWNDVLTPGALLSIPRGWWHVAYPMDEPCLHLTVTIRNHNGIDLLHWFADRMKASEAARMSLPVIGTAEERRAWLDRVFSDMSSAWGSNLFDEYLAHVDWKAVPRPQISLPSEPDFRNNGTIQRDTLLKIAGVRPLHFIFDNGSALCRANGAEWKMDPEAARKMAIFNDFQPHTIGELGPRPDLRVHAAVIMMLMSGVIRRVSG